MLISIKRKIFGDTYGEKQLFGDIHKSTILNDLWNDLWNGWVEIKKESGKTRWVRDGNRNVRGKRMNDWNRF